MFATRRDQENLIHSHQTAAASKPLNQQQGSTRFAPKTPAAGHNNGPYQTARRTNWRKDDENEVSLKTTTKGPSNFNLQTPTAAKDRAPLGAKTTNAKAKGLQTPGPQAVGQGFQKTQRRSASARKPKLKIHQSELVAPDALPLHVDESGDEPEIEYCPPKVQELPNYPSDHEDLSIPPMTFRDIARINVEKNRDKWIKKQKEEEAKYEEMLDREIEKAMRECEEVGFSTIDANGPREIETSDKGAARALSQKPRPRFAAPTNASLTKRNISEGQATIGYAAGRKVSNTINHKRQQSSNSTLKTRSTVATKRAGKSVEAREEPEFDDDAEEDDDFLSGALWRRNGSSTLDDDDDEDIEQFKLPLPKYDENDDD